MSSLEKWLISGLEQGKYKMNLELLLVPESKGVFKKQWGHVERGQEQCERTLNRESWSNLSNKIIMILNNPQN